MPKRPAQTLDKTRTKSWIKAGHSEHKRTSCDEWSRGYAIIHFIFKLYTVTKFQEPLRTLEISNNSAWILMNRELHARFTAPATRPLSLFLGDL